MNQIQLAPTTPYFWLAELADAKMPRDVATLIAQFVQSQPGCASATVVWGLDKSRTVESEPVCTLDQDELALVRKAAALSLPVTSDDGACVAVALSQPQSAVLLLTLTPGIDGRRVLENIDAVMQVAGRHLHRAF